MFTFQQSRFNLRNEKPRVIPACHSAQWADPHGQIHFYPPCLAPATESQLATVDDVDSDVDSGLSDWATFRNFGYTRSEFAIKK